MTSEPEGRSAALAALTPEARHATGGPELALSAVPFRVGRDSRSDGRPLTAALPDWRHASSRRNNELYLTESEPLINVSREHFQIEGSGGRYVLVDRRSTCGTIVEGRMIGGNQSGGSVELADGDVIIVGTSASRYVFKFRTR